MTPRSNLCLLESVKVYKIRMLLQKKNHTIVYIMQQSCKRHNLIRTALLTHVHDKYCQ